MQAWWKSRYRVRGLAPMGQVGDEGLNFVWICLVFISLSLFHFTRLRDARIQIFQSPSAES